VVHERDIAEEQAFLARALAALDHMRDEARYLRDQAAVAHMNEAGDLVQRDVVMNTALQRLDQLAIGDAPLFFGRIDYGQGGPESGASYHVGRLAVTDEELEPLVVDWRAPIAEGFYRATGVEPLGLARRRHISIVNNTVQSVEDEYFADSDGNISLPEGDAADLTADGLLDGGLALGGAGALLAALGRARTGRMGDIVATIQGEQDLIIRSPLPGILIVQGGPGTGKTAVALHRSAYLLFTHRVTLERQGVLVVGPNPLFLNYIENVLPSLGESGVTLSTISQLIVNVPVRGVEADEIAALKGDLRMARVISRAVRTRQRALRQDVVIAFGRGNVTLTVAASEDAVERARRRPGNHNSRRSALGRELATKLAADYRARYRLEQHDEDGAADDIDDRIRRTPQFKAAMARMWPRLSGQELLHDLFGAPALIRAAGAGILTDDECALLVRERSEDLDDVRWTDADAALIDEARVVLGPRRRPRAVSRGENILDGLDLDAYAPDVRAAAVREATRLAPTMHLDRDEAEFQTYGHIVIDEAQDLSPMQLRVVKRRDLSGSMTIVGDMGQATTAASSASWDTVIEVLEPRRTVTRVDLSVSYRTPREVLDFAAPTLRAATPDLEPPQPVREVGYAPVVRAAAADFAEALVDEVRRMTEQVAPGRIAVVVTAPRVGEICDLLTAAGLVALNATTSGGDALSAPLAVVAAEGSNGLEFDGVVVVEPREIARRGGSGELTSRGLRTLYVAMTRPTKRLTLVHREPLPPTIPA
jgi:DNA helicase IV